MSSPRSQRQLLSSLVLLTTVTAVVSSLGAPLIPSIAEKYAVPLAGAQWALTATLIAGAVATPVVGRLGTGRFRRPVILGGLVVVLAGTVLAALPVGFAGLVVGRTLQGVGLALVPLAIAVARDMWAGPRMSSVVALLSVTTVAGAGLGYPITAFVAEHTGIAGAYWFGTALVLVTLASAVRTIPVIEGPAQPIDAVGAALLSVGSVSVLLAVSQGERWGWTSSAVLAMGLGGAAVGVAWVGWTLRRRFPLVDLHLAVRPGVAGPNFVALIAGVGMYGLLTLVVVLVRADDPGFGLDLGVAVAGLMLMPYSVMSVVGSQVARAVSRRLGPPALLPIGCTVFASSLLLLALEHTHLWQALLAMAIGGLGSGFTFSSLAVLIVPHVPARETGSAMAFNQLLRYLGFSTGSALSVALMETFGGGSDGFRGAMLALAGVCLLAAV
ncbi:MAG: MFS transporter, partial [Nocardioides sp.]